MLVNEEIQLLESLREPPFEALGPGREPGLARGMAVVPEISHEHRGSGERRMRDVPAPGHVGDDGSGLELHERFEGGIDQVAVPKPRGMTELEREPDVARAKREEPPE